MTLTEQMQVVTDVAYVDMVAHLCDVATLGDKIIAAYGGWEDN